MYKCKWNVGISVLAFTIMISLLSVLMTPVALSQENAENAVFSVSPGAFTASDVPPLGSPYIIPQQLVVWNRDNIDRVVTIRSAVPPENSITPGYAPIPNENWITPFPSSILIKADNYAIIELSFNIPRWENLTGENWEVWIPVQRQPLPGEIGVLIPTVRIDIKTTQTLPPAQGGVSLALLLTTGIVIAVVVICIGLWYWSKRMGKGKKPVKRVISRSQG
jgi:hypothetical protein